MQTTLQPNNRPALPNDTMRAETAHSTVTEVMPSRVLDVRAEYKAFKDKHLSMSYFTVAMVSSVAYFVMTSMNDANGQAFVGLLRSMPRQTASQVADLVEALVAWCDSSQVVLLDQ